MKDKDGCELSIGDGVLWTSKWSQNVTDKGVIYEKYNMLFISWESSDSDSFLDGMAESKLTKISEATTDKLEGYTELDNILIVDEVKPKEVTAQEHTIFEPIASLTRHYPNYFYIRYQL